jgi:hypothetical protein
MSDPKYRRAAELMEADVGDELVALDPDKGSCFGFNSVATAVWRQLSQPRRLSELHCELMAQYEVDSDQCRSELQSLLDDMLEKGLVQLAD